MKHFFNIALVALALTTSGVVNAQNRWHVYAGGSISHLCEKPLFGSDQSYGWGGGAFLGGGYEINFNSHWSLSPQLEFAFNNNGATLNSKEFSFYNNHSEWRSTWSVNIPVIASFRFPVSDTANLRFGAGPYLQEGLAGRRYKYDTNEKENLTGNAGNRFNVGAIGEVAVETGSHFSYMFRVQYPFLKEGWIRKTINLSVGVNYSF
jgi:hypothetical protein